MSARFTTYAILAAALLSGPAAYAVEASPPPFNFLNRPYGEPPGAEPTAHEGGAVIRRSHMHGGTPYWRHYHHHHMRMHAE